jgi:Xaa-Pro dipeptidase
MSATTRPAPISETERHQRLATLRLSMETAGIQAVLLGSTESLRYFTGLVWHQSERLVGALITAGDLFYIVPGFERSRVDSLSKLDGEIVTWEEDESSAETVANLLSPKDRVALDDALPLFVYHALARTIGTDRLVDGARLIRDIRLRKSETEIGIIQYAMNLTLEVHRRAHGFVKPGVLASDVVRYIDEQHRSLGAEAGSSFCIVSFGEATSLPHGADGEQTYAPAATSSSSTPAAVSMDTIPT